MWARAPESHREGLLVGSVVTVAWSVCGVRGFGVAVHSAREVHCVPGPRHWDLLFRKLPVGLESQRLCVDGFRHPLDVSTCHFCPHLVRAWRSHTDLPALWASLPVFDAAEIRVFHPGPVRVHFVVIKYGLFLKWGSWQPSLQKPDHGRLSDDRYLQPKPKVFKKRPFLLMLCLK